MLFCNVTVASWHRLRFRQVSVVADEPAANKGAIRMVYPDTDSGYEIALIVARMDSLKDRREMLMARFFTRQVLASNDLLHCLLPERRDNDTIRSLKNSQPFLSIRGRTN